ncbi:MAG: hypothetical protein JWM47_2108 [Acidimicrobiales bacterium]|nr:hypothetical protein [Acidimicrobiales bacterium]
MTAASVPSIPGFEDLRPLGRGGFSVVYQATQVGLGRQVAVKVLNLDVSDEGAQRRFDRECRAVGALSGIRGIVGVHQSAFATDGRMAIVMELMAGGTLDERVRARGPVSAADVSAMGEKLAGALAAAHQRGIAHRDIKPGNILMSADGEVALADFGIALVAEMEHSSRTEASLSPPYAAPERFTGNAVDEERSDLYALGATMFFALAGRPPFGTSAEGGISGLAQRVLHDPLPMVGAGVASDLQALLQALTAKDPAQRPPGAAHVRDRFAAIAAQLSDAGATTVETRTAPLPGSSIPAPSPGRPIRFAESPAAASTNGSTASTNGQTRAVVWPTGIDYVSAVQDPGSLRSPRLQRTSPVLDTMGMPVSATGQSTVVFQLRSADGVTALRCFTREPVDGAQRYRSLAEHLADHPVDCLVPAEWHDDAIVVDRVGLPVVVMPWVPGCPLGLALERLLDQPDRIRELAARWLDVLDRLSEAEVAHGDLQNGNVLVDEALDVRLVDLDGIWIPSIADRPPAEHGHPNFQHPGRSSAVWDAGVDTFSGVVIYLSLIALAADPALWTHHMGENLILGADDYVDPGATAAWRDLAGSPDPAVRALAGALAGWCAAPTPPIGSVRALVARHDPRADAGDIAATRVRPQAPAPLTDASPVQPATPVDSEAPWWDTGSDPTETRAADDAPAADGSAAALTGSSMAWLGRNSAISGLFAGSVAALVGGLLQGSLYPPIPSHPTSAGLLVVLVTALSGGLIAGWPHLTARAWAGGLKMLFVGTAVGAVGGGLAMAVVNPIFLDNTEASEPVPLGLLVVIWVMVAVVAGVAAGATRSLRAVASGVLGGLVGGAVGGAVFWRATDPNTSELRALLVDGTDPATLVALMTTGAIIGVAVGLAGRVTRLASLTVIEGRIKGRVVNIDRQETTIGSGSGCAVVLSGDPGVLAEHARVRILDQQATVVPVGPVKLNGSTVVAASALRTGDIVQIGGSFMRFERAGEAQ